MELIIDNRESIKKYFNDKNLEWVKFQNLDLGDYVFNYNEELVCIIERKTIEDLASSIKDGRYREQKSRLIMNYPKSKLIYLIEGDFTKPNNSIKYNKVSKNTIYSSLINMYLRDNINCFHTNNESETIEFLEQMAAKLQKQGKKFLIKTNTRDSDLFNNLKTSKKNITCELVYKLQLSSIPAISNKYADAIITKYPTMKNLFEKLVNEESVNRINIIKNIEYNVNDVKKRKLGKKVAENLEKYLFQ